MLVPFGGGEHDWAAVELGAWMAAATGEGLRLAGPRPARSAGRDASRLLADASLAVQRTTGIAAEPALVDSGPGGLLAAAAGATAVVVGLSPRWRREGLGDARRALVADPRCPVLVVHRGLRPSGIAPREAATRFTWSLSGASRRARAERGRGRAPCRRPERAAQPTRAERNSGRDERREGRVRGGAAQQLALEPRVRRPAGAPAVRRRARSSCSLNAASSHVTGPAARAERLGVPDGGLA